LRSPGWDAVCFDGLGCFPFACFEGSFMGVPRVGAAASRKKQSRKHEKMKAGKETRAVNRG